MPSGALRQADARDAWKIVLVLRVSVRLPYSEISSFVPWPHFRTFFDREIDNCCSLENCSYPGIYVYVLPRLFFRTMLAMTIATAINSAVTYVNSVEPFPPSGETPKNAFYKVHVLKPPPSWTCHSQLRGHRLSDAIKIPATANLFNPKFAKFSAILRPGWPFWPARATAN